MNADPKSGKKVRRWLIVVAPLFLGMILPFALLALSQSSPFYYRHFNRIQALFEKMPDTLVVDSWRHEDITLEDFGLTLQVRQCPRIQVDFYEGADWYQYFEAIDGIVFSKPFNPAMRGFETTNISCDELVRAGVPVRNLADVVSRLEAVLAYLKERATDSPPKPRVPGSHVRIYYDLDAYRQVRR